ncbi:MAG: hypothetical protein JXO22_14825 [Phycisphaerae bacterium]|nr:hypothetical protein [Phycisphaerae bacterium]
MNTEIVLKYTPGRNGTGVLAARLGDDLIHTDKLDPTKASHRKRFAKAVIDKCPALQSAAVERELLGIADGLARASDAAPDVDELDYSRIIRPELFHTSDVSGLAIPSVRLLGGKPVGKWTLYLRWHADGRRERCDLTESLELPDGGRLWISPLPGEPEPTMRARWSARARATWLDGADAPDPAEVWSRVAERITYYLDFPPDIAADTVAMLSVWVILSYMYPAWPSVPYMYVTGPAATGKSTLFRVLSRLVFQPLESSNMTAPCLFRTLHERGGVLLLDEAERLRDGTPDAGDLRSILLSGYKRGSPAIRLEKANDGFKRVTFDVYGPKALAAIASLPEALASRCIRVSMFRAAADSPKQRRRLDEQPGLWAGIRDDLHALALEHGTTWLELVGRHDVVPDAVAGRDYELWQPLMALAVWLESCGASGLLRVIQDHAEHVIESNQTDAVPESDELLLRLLAGHVVCGTARTLKAGDLLKQARDTDPVTLGRWSPKGVGNALSRYGISTRKGHGNIGRTYSTVTLSMLRQIEETYAFDLGLPDENVPPRAASAAEPA